MLLRLAGCSFLQTITIWSLLKTKSKKGILNSKQTIYNSWILSRCSLSNKLKQIWHTDPLLLFFISLFCVGLVGFPSFDLSFTFHIWVVICPHSESPIPLSPLVCWICTCRFFLCWEVSVRWRICCLLICIIAFASINPWFTNMRNECI